MKRLLISISYHYFVLPEGADISGAIKTIGHLMPVERESYEGQTIYSPEKDVSISFDLIDEKLIRIPTPEEKENKKIKDLESSISYRDSQIKERDSRIKELECIVDQYNRTQEDTVG